MLSKLEDLDKEDIAGIVIGVVLGVVLLIGLWMFLRYRRREKRLRSQIENAATFTATAYRTKSMGTEDDEEMASASRDPTSRRPSEIKSRRPSEIDYSSSPMGSRYSEAPDRAIPELNPYNYRMRPELATIKSQSQVELSMDEKTGGVPEVRNGPHELEASPKILAVPQSAKVAEHVLGENESDAGSPFVGEVKEFKI